MTRFSKSQKHLKWVLGLTSCIMLLFSFGSNSTALADSTVLDLAPHCQSGVLIDLNSGQLLWSKNPHMHEYPASITKIVTADIAIENGKPTDIVTVPPEAPLADGNRVYLLAGEQIPLEQMLYGLLLNSGNDAAIAIADHFAGSQEQFAKMMNQKALSVGATDTHFVTPNGLHDDQHYTSAYDMALLTQDAMKKPLFRQIVQTKTYPWHGQGWDSTLVNLNEMLWTYDGATGVKTGFTDQAQQTIVVSAERDGRELLAVLMHCDGKPAIHQDAANVLDYGFKEFKKEVVKTAGDTLIVHSKQAIVKDTITYEAPLSDENSFETSITYDPPKPPYGKGTHIGTLNVYHNKQLVGKSELLAAVDEPAPELSVSMPFKFWFETGSIFIVTIAFLALVLFFPRIQAYQLSKRESEAN